MRIKLIVEDAFLHKYCGLAKGATRTVQRIRYVTNKRKNPDEIVGYYVLAPILYPCNHYGQFKETFIRRSESVELPEHPSTDKNERV